MLKTNTFIFLFISLNCFVSHAVEFHFNQGEITSLGEVTIFPSILGWLESSKKFSAAVNSLESKTYKFENEKYQSVTEPLTVRPVFLSSGLSKSWGGWSLIIKNNSDNFKTFSSEFINSTQTDVSMETNYNNLNALIGAGLKLSENWSIGWNLVVNQIEYKKNELKSENSNSVKKIVFSQQSTKQNSLQSGMGFTYKNQTLVYGFHFTSPFLFKTHQGQSSLYSLEIPLNEFLNTKEDFALNYKSYWTVDNGIRFGHKGFVYILGDTYESIGAHQIKLGFEYRGSWGNISTGYTHYTFESIAKSKWLVGFSKKDENFRWSVGPFIERVKNNAIGELQVFNYGIIYASEISYQ